jgi:hypothetical protein
VNKHDKAWKKYSDDFRADGLPKIVGSDTTISLFGGDGSDFNVQQATELGAMLLLDKPIILLLIRGAAPPTRLMRAADVVIADWSGSPEDQDRLTAAIMQLREEL